ncbi:TPA: hypothetical protein U2C09_001769 [Streptococcus suis]|nr:hypothetical protein [Streptococcus suis]
MKLYFLGNKNYQSILNDYHKAMKTILTLREYDTKEDRIQAEKEQKQQELFEATISFVNSESQKLRETIHEIKKRYANTNSIYKDPQSEILKRQDFDLEIGMMSELQIKDFLRDSDRQFSSYELNRIGSQFKENVEVLNLVKSLKNNIVPNYQKDSDFQEATSKLNQLSLIDKKTPRELLLYIPADNHNDFSTVNLNGIDLNGTFDDIDSLKNRMNNFGEVIKHLPKADNSWKADLSKHYSEKTAKSEKQYQDFDERIFKNSKNYDIFDRFKYLKERFDNSETDLFDPTREDYSIVSHMSYLEKQHDKKLATDPEYKEMYQKAELELS